jgi:hypothetical protein
LPYEFQSNRAREAENGIVRSSSSRQPADTEDRDPAIAFDYLLREPRHARHRRQMLHIMAGIVALATVAWLLWPHVTRETVLWLVALWLSPTAIFLLALIFAQIKDLVIRRRNMHSVDTDDAQR